MKLESLEFELFRYQLLPIDRQPQGDLFQKSLPINELIANKNKILGKLLSTQLCSSLQKEGFQCIKLFEKGDYYVFRLAPNRSLHREKQDFTDETIDNWPSFFVVFMNEPSVQTIYVQKKTAAFQKTKAVVNFLKKILSTHLALNNLTIDYETIKEKNTFWTIVQSYKGSIQSLEFEFITPNMAEISKNLSKNVKQFAKSTNSKRNKLSIEADDGSVLHLDKENSDLNGLVEYTEEGGGNASFKIKNIKKKIKTNKSIKTVQIEALDVEGRPEKIVEMIQSILK